MFQKYNVPIDLCNAWCYTPDTLQYFSPGKEGVLHETFIIISTISSRHTHDTVNPSGTFQHSYRLLQSRSQIHRKNSFQT